MAAEVGGAEIAAVAALVALAMVSMTTVAVCVAVELMPVAAAAVTAFETFFISLAAALAGSLVAAGEGVPKLMQRRAVMSGEEAVVRAARTEKRG